MKKPIAYYAETCALLIVIYDIEYGIEDYIVYSYKTPNNEGKKIRAKIRYNVNGDAYFRVKNPVILSDCVKY